MPESSMWTRFDIELNFLTRLSASVPAQADLQRKWLESRQPKNRPPDSRSIDEIAEEVANTVPEEIDDERGLYVFQRQEGGLVLRMATFRAHLKDCARVLSSLYVGKIEKEKSFAQKVINAVYYPPEIYWVPILSQLGEGVVVPTGSSEKVWHAVNAPTGTYEKTIHVRTRLGERSAFKTMEYVTGAMVRFQILVMTQPSGRLVIPEKDIELLWEYGGTHGYGGERGDGEGRYVATVTKVEK